jgi:ribosomal protein L11 methyltransferase
MKRPSLWQVSVTTTSEAEDAVAELLSAIFDLPASTYYDNESGASTVTVYLQQQSHLSRKLRADVLAGLERIRSCGLNLGSGKIVIAMVRRENWAESWKRHFKPIEIGFKNRNDEFCESPSARNKSGTRVTRPSEKLGKSLLIKPSWSKRKPQKDQAVIVLDPGLSFGTGQHPTTAFCLGQIVQFPGKQNKKSHRSDGSASRPYLKPRSFLDLGTGSGILAIAAAKLGYSPILGLDFDPEAVRVARANARANRVLQRVKIRRGDVTKLPILPGQRGHGYDLVCANLISDLLIAQRRRIAAQLDPHGTLVLAGILRSEFAMVQKAYKTVGLRLVSHLAAKEWCSGSFRFAG